MKQLIDNLPKTDNVDYLLDTCFMYYVFRKDKIKTLVNFCKNNKVGMTSFNLEELDYIHHKFKGHTIHHLRDFLKLNIMSNLPVSVSPGNIQAEKEYVQKYDNKVLEIINDPSDAVMFVAALKVHGNNLTKDKHHVFTAAAENYSMKHNVEILNNFPK